MLDKRGKILFVDDDIPLLNAFSRNLRGLYDFEMACGSHAALEIIEKSPSFAVIVSDMNMDGLNGNQLFQTVKEISPDTVCIMLTGYADINAALDAVNNNTVFRFLTKPCPRETLIQALDDALKHYSRKGERINYIYSIEIDQNRQTIKRSSDCYFVTGYTAREITEHENIRYEMILPEFRKMYIEYFEKLLKGQQAHPIEFQIKRKDGKIRWLRDTVITRINSEGIASRCDGYVEDITPFKELSRRLQQTEARFERVTSNLPGVVFQCIYNRQKDEIAFTYISESCYEILTFRPENLNGNIERFSQIFDSQTLTSFKKAFKFSADSFTPCNWQGKAEVKDRKRWFQVLAKPENIGNGKWIFDGLMLDITVRVRTENQLRIANERLKENDRLKSEFVSTVSHELRTPLFIFKNIISNTLSGAYGRINSKLRKNFEMADSTIDRLARIISDFLDCSKIEAGALKLSLKPCSIQKIVAEVSESFKSIALSKDLHIKSIMPKKALMVNIDSDRMIQVMTNLIGNAVKFSDKPGNINIFINDHINEIEVSIQDNGPGISKEDIDKLFKKFMRVHKVVDKVHDGTGLGLYIVKELVELHKGRIWVDSKSGQGSCFSFILPKHTELPEHSNNLILEGAKNER